MIALEESSRFEARIECSPTGNRTPVLRVTGGDTHLYTIEEKPALASSLPANEVNECKQSRIKMPSRVMCVDRVNAAETTARKWVSTRGDMQR